MDISKTENQSFTNNDFDVLTNGSYQQILFSNGCSPATFNQDCIAKHYIVFIRKPLKPLLYQGYMHKNTSESFLVSSFRKLHSE